MLHRLTFVLIALLLAAPASAQSFALPPAQSSKVVDVIDGDTVKLTSGREVRFVGIQAPKLPLGRRNFAEWPLAGEAQAKLTALIGDKPVTLHYGGAREDRHGRFLAHLTVTSADGNTVWLQGEMLRAGLARVYSFPDNRALVAEMLTLEREARAQRRGIWADRYYVIRKPDQLAREIDTFQLVEGRVLSAAMTKDRAYLNFGADYRSDFTVAIARRDLKQFGREGNAKTWDAKAWTETWQGRTIRVRGWLKSLNGPMIEATHPEQIEVLTP